MRDPKRIDKNLAILGELWHKVPDLRFGQLLQILEIPKEKNVTDPFYWEDDVWEEIFQRTLDKYQ